MIVEAKSWVNVDGVWHRPGERYEVPDTAKPVVKAEQKEQEPEKAMTGTRRPRRKAAEK